MPLTVTADVPAEIDDLAKRLWPASHKEALAGIKELLRRCSEDSELSESVLIWLSVDE